MNLRNLIIVEVHQKILLFQVEQEICLQSHSGKEALIYHVRNDQGQRRPLYQEIITHLGIGELGEFISPLSLTKTHMYTIYITHDTITCSPSYSYTHTHTHAYTHTHTHTDTHPDTHTHTPRHTLDPQWTTVTKGDKSHFHCRLKCVFYKQWGWDCFQAGSGMKWFQLLMWPL